MALPLDHPPSPTVEGRKARPAVLIVEDDPRIRESIARFVDEADCEAVAAAGGQEALRILGSRRINVVLLDVLMPDMDGYQVCERIRERKDLPHIPIVFLTAKGDPLDKARGFFSRADAYLTKPFKKEDLQQVLRTVLDGNTDVWKKDVLENIPSLIESLKRYRTKLAEEMFLELLRSVEGMRKQTRKTDEELFQRALAELLARNPLVPLDFVDRLVAEFAKLQEEARGAR